jgi:hypothetical protein
MSMLWWHWVTGEWPSPGMGFVLGCFDAYLLYMAAFIIAGPA